MKLTADYRQAKLEKMGNAFCRYGKLSIRGIMESFYLWKDIQECR
jgi:hypothetical protein